MGRVPIKDVWLLARSKVKRFGSFPAGFLERARNLLGIHINDACLHVCGGAVRDYPYSGFGPNDKTIDLDPMVKPDYLMDVRSLGVADGDFFPLKNGAILEVGDIGSLTFNDGSRATPSGFDVPHGSQLWDAALIDLPYSEEYAKEYPPGSDKLPNLNDTVKRTLSVVRPGGRVGILDFRVPKIPTNTKEIALVAVIAGTNCHVRVFTVLERLIQEASQEKSTIECKTTESVAPMILEES